MKLERIVELVETSGDMSVRYSRKTATMPEKDKKRLQEMLADDRLIFFDGANMRTYEALSYEFQIKFKRKRQPFEKYICVDYEVELVIDCWFERDAAFKHTMLIFENADQILRDSKEQDGVMAGSFDEFVRDLEKAGNHAARPFNEPDLKLKRGPIGFNAILLFDPKVKRPDVGNAQHLKL
ncbi:MAG: hypothetical protein ABJN26_07200 [Stappiaceae bacterium]|uniref:hypothetical protein n=1 Tax=Alphaproteobacteria TaxID=28211 RepID=UPI0032976C92